MGSLRKSRRILRHAYTLYRRKWRSLSSHHLKQIEDLLSRLDRAVLAKDRARASELAREVQQLLPTIFRKSFLDYAWELGSALVFALVIATIVRQMWFEPMEIPSGSMRPTFQEQDRLIATKTNFGLNIPLTTGHFYFDPELVQRTGVFIFTSQDMDIPDQDTRYFLIFPGKRRLIKRCMGKPGDTLYFYGGKIYGMDRDGNDLKELRSAPWLKGIDAVPFINFTGKVEPAPDGRAVYLKQFNQPIARLSRAGRTTRSELFVDGKWVEGGSSHSYGQLFGMRNYAMARLLTSSEVSAFSESSLDGLSEGALYLELRHNPGLSYPQPRLATDRQGQIIPILTPEVSLIPLNSNQLDRLMDAMYTARFVVTDGRAHLYSMENGTPQPSSYDPEFPGVPNGRYQVQGGEAFNVGWGGILEKLPLDHPLNARTPANIQRLFNVGMEMNTAFAPHRRLQLFYPSRYSYFRNGALYVMGGEVLAADDPTLMAFNAAEDQREKAGTKSRPYRPFKDYGSPLLDDGTLNTDLLQTFGLKVPPEGYLALGDNYASSSDSRVFGFVPEANLRGAPWEIFWPPGPRWGAPSQKPYPFMNGPRLFVWIVTFLVLVTLFIIRAIRNRRPIFKKKSH